MCYLTISVVSGLGEGEGGSWGAEADSDNYWGILIATEILHTFTLSINMNRKRLSGGFMGLLGGGGMGGGFPMLSSGPVLMWSDSQNKECSSAATLPVRCGAAQLTG